MDQIGDAHAALKYFDQALALRRQWLVRAVERRRQRGVANILGAIAHAYLRLGDPAKARDRYREELGLRDQLSAQANDQLEVRRERAGLSDRLGDLSLSLGEPRDASEHFQVVPAIRREIAAQNRDETHAQRDVLLSLQKVGNFELIYSHDAKTARERYQEALDGFLERLKAEPASVPRDGRSAGALLRCDG